MLGEWPAAARRPDTSEVAPEPRAGWTEERRRGDGGSRPTKRRRTLARWPEPRAGWTEERRRSDEGATRRDEGSQRTRRRRPPKRLSRGAAWASRWRSGCWGAGW